MKLILLLLLSQADCASCTPVQWGSDLRPHDGHKIQISGKLIFGLVYPSNLYLCPPSHTGDPTGECLDVVASNTLVVKLRTTTPKCVSVAGKFTAFGPDTIGLGYFRSNIGFIQATKIARCHGR